MISAEDSQLVHEAGGQYRGFVQDKAGTRFEDVFITNRSYYDSEHKKIIKLQVWTDGVDEFGDSDAVREPRGVKGFSTMVTKWDASGKDVEPGKFIDILPANFPNRRISLREMRQLTREVLSY